VALSVLDELRELGPVSAVHGNVDEPELRALLPAQAVIELGEARLGVVHDAGPRAGREARLVSRFPACDGIVFGHSHLPEISRHGASWILNPGSPTERRRAAARTMIRLLVGQDGSLAPELVEVA
jgi:putative phosphoesterase